MKSKYCGFQKERIKVDTQTKNPGIFRYRGSESGGYLLSPDAISAVPSAMLCVGGSAASPRHAPVSAHTARPTPSATADTARASETGLAMSNGD